MKQMDARWSSIASMLVLVLAMGCSDDHPDPTGGTGGGGVGGSGAGGTSGSGGGAPDAGGAAGGDGGVTIEEACAHVARVTCQKYSECLPHFVLATFGTIDTCITQYVATLCRNHVGLEDSGDTPAATEACAVARAAATCAQWFDNDVAVSACLPQPGTRATGARCGQASQCQTNVCDIAQGATCGTCGKPLVGAGAPCTSSNECEGNLQCFDGACGLPRGLGQPCSPAGACQYAFQCIGGRCGVPAQAGEACGMVPCRIRAGLTCANNTCVPIQFAGAGEPCDNVERFCLGTGFCKMTPPVLNGTCTAGAADGEACNDVAGPYCMPWASCIGGVCKVPDLGICK
jgi:hypothetical protein